MFPSERASFPCCHDFRTVNLTAPRTQETMLWACAGDQGQQNEFRVRLNKLITPMKLSARHFPTLGFPLVPQRLFLAVFTHESFRMLHSCL